MTHVALSGVSVRYGATTILRDVTWTVGAQDKWGIIGRNGAGKTTLVNVVLGRTEPTTGQVTRMPGLRMAVLEQQPDFGGHETVWNAVADAFASLQRMERKLADQAARLEHASPAEFDRYANDLARFEADGGYTYHAKVDAILDGMGFDHRAAHHQRLETLSGGERSRVALAKQLAAPVDLLLLDEPTNHLDLDTTKWLEGFLRESRETLLLISHDRAFLEATVDHVLHVDAGTTRAYPGSYSAFVEQRAQQRLTQERAAAKQGKEIAREEDYIRRNIAGQNSKQAKGRLKRLRRLPRLAPPPGAEGAMALALSATDRGGDRVAELLDVTLRVGDRTLVTKATGVVRRSDRVGLIGPNGAGKTTLVRALMGERGIEGGELRLGGSTRPAYLRQDLSQIPPATTIYDALSALRPLWNRGQIQGHLGRFLFSGDEVQRSTDVLSGGERARLALAILTLTGANFIVLDEPTNHLDVESIESLEDALEAYDGTVLLVSHDREFLRRMTTRVWEVRNESLRCFDGSFMEWEERDAARTEEEEPEPTPAPVTVERAPRPDRALRGQLRAAIADVERAERQAHEADARVQGLETALLDPQLFESPDGRIEAARLGRELAQARRDAELALERWTAAEEALGALRAVDGASR